MTDIDQFTRLGVQPALLCSRWLYRRWRLNPTQLGARALLYCGTVAAAKQAAGERWDPKEIYDAYAEWTGDTPEAVRRNIRYALRAAGVGLGTAAALATLGRKVARQLEDGVFTEQGG